MPTALHRRPAIRLAVAIWLVSGASRAQGEPTIEPSTSELTIDSSTHVMAYDVASPGSPAILARRRLVQTLGFSFGRDLGPPSDRERVPRFRATLRLRLDQEFGDTCLVAEDLCLRATAPSAIAEYQPLVRDSRIDAPLGYIEVRDLPLGAAAQLGRLLQFDAAGFTRFDGAHVEVSPVSWLSVHGFGGAVVRDTSIAGNDTFAPAGRIRIDLPEEAEPLRYPWLESSGTTWAAGGGLSIGPPRLVRATASVRSFFEDEGNISATGALALVLNAIPNVRVDASGVVDPYDLDILRLHAGARTDVGPVELHGRVDRTVPWFDAGTIWGYFDLVPISEAVFGAELRPFSTTRIGAEVFGRRADFDDDVSEEDGGLSVHASARILGRTVALAGYVSGGDLGPLAGVTLEVIDRLWAPLELSANISVWHFDDPLRQGLHGASVSEVLAAVFAMSRQSTLRVEGQHSYNQVRGHELRGMLALFLDVWR